MTGRIAALKVIYERLQWAVTVLRPSMPKGSPITKARSIANELN